MLPGHLPLLLHFPVLRRAKVFMLVQVDSVFAPDKLVPDSIFQDFVVVLKVITGVDLVVEVIGNSLKLQILSLYSAVQ